MKKLKMIVSLTLVAALMLFTLAGCNTAKKEVTDPASAEATGAEAKATFNYSESIDENGFWKGVKALDVVELCEYTGIKVPSDTHAVKDEVIQAEIDTLLAGFVTEEQIKDRAVTETDTLNIDYIGSVDGVPFEGGSTDGAGTNVTIGVTQYIDDFLQQLVGHKPGESFDIEVTFPADYGTPDLAGKDAVFAITINYIVKTVNPELTDAFVKTNLSADRGWNTVEEMKAGIKAELQSTAVIGFVQEYVLQQSKVKTLPVAILKHQEDAMIAFYQGNADSYQLELDEFLSTYIGVPTVADLLVQSKEENTNAANSFLITQAIAEDAGITVTDKDVAAYFLENTGSEDYAEYETYYGLPYLKQIVLNQAVLSHLEANAILE